ncbi:MAG: hypothetical protein IJC68_04875, partial [Firmicutes bacterium]|nr:hypothetical protein [Bacillota bacterium]
MKKEDWKRTLALLLAVLLLPVFPGGGSFLQPLAVSGGGADPLQTSSEEEVIVLQKYWKDMTKEEKTSALQLLLAGEDGFAVPESILAEGISRPLNRALWYSHGILVYGEGFGGWDDAAGPRYWGYDVNGGYYGNDAFPRDSDTGTEAWKKSWLTVEQIRRNETARIYVGSYALENQNRFSEEDRRTTAALWLAKNPEWLAAGLTEDYILSHFCFNSAVSESGLTRGQFIGVHRSVYDGNLYYQTFDVEAPLRLFKVVAKEEPVPEAPQPSSDLQVTAQLSAPESVYAGEGFTVRDRSLFLVEGISYLAGTAYETLPVENEFAAAGSMGTVQRISQTEAEVVFDREGRWPVNLTVRETGTGKTWTATSYVTVKPVPAPEVFLGGPHKANRTETMTIALHLHPSRPAKVLDLLIRDPETGTVWLHLRKDFETGTETVSGKGVGEELTDAVRITDGRVKARPLTQIVTEGTGLGQETWQLEFLTKNGEQQVYAYELRLTDSGGYSGTASGTFTMEPDRAPAAEIRMAEQWVRGESGNRAAVEAEDGSRSDGDEVTRRWLLDAGDGVFREFSWEDRSFGTGQAIAFAKEGVGPFRLKLQAQDLWTEETLEEFVTAADVLSGEAVAAGEVINLAPKVGVKLVEDPPLLQVLLLTETEDEKEQAEAQLEAVSGRLRAKNLQAAFTVRALSPAAALRADGAAADSAGEGTGNAGASGAADSAPGGASRLVKTISETEYGYEASWTFLNNAYAVDDYRLYTVTASYETGGANDDPAPPYTLRAYNCADGTLLWTYSLTETVMAVSNSGSFQTPNDRLITDLSCELVYFRSGLGETLVLDARTGTFLTVLPYDIGGGAWFYENRIYSFAADGIRRTSGASGETTLLQSGVFLGKAGNGSSGLGTAVSAQRGKALLAEIKDGTLYRTVFDPKTESLQRTALQTAGSETWKVLGMDAKGKLILHDSSSQKMSVYNEGGLRVFYGGYGEPAASHGVVYDGAGVCNYGALVTNTYYDDYFGMGPMAECRMRVYRFADGKSKSYTLTDSYASPTTSNIILAVEREDALWLVTGTIWSYVLNFGYSAYTQLPVVWEFDFAANTSARGTLSDHGLDAVVETGLRSDGYLVTRAEDCNPAQPVAINRILVAEQTEEEILRRTENRYLREEGDLQVTVHLAEGAAQASDFAEMLTETLLQKAAAGGIVTEEETVSTIYIYETGETILYDVSYADPESDPSKRQYWRYTKDGEAAGPVLSEPITVFTEPGRYLAEHWQEDSTGDSAYDLESNHVSFLLYITGEGEEPEIPKSLEGWVRH